MVGIFPPHASFFGCDQYLFVSKLHLFACFSKLLPNFYGFSSKKNRRYLINAYLTVIFLIPNMVVTRHNAGSIDDAICWQLALGLR